MLAILLTLIGGLICYGVFKLGRTNQDYYKGTGLKHLEPRFIVGNSWPLFSKKLSIFDFIKSTYDQFATEKAFGIFGMRSPIVIVRDPEMVKHLVVKEFDHFADHRVFVDEKIDSLLGNSLITMKGQKWRDMRTTLSPAFTGSKMRLMFQLIVELCEQLVGHLDQDISTDVNTVKEYEMKELCGRFTNDIIALCAFGLKVNSLEGGTEFYDCGSRIMDFMHPSKAWKILLTRISPKLVSLLRIKIIDEEAKAYFKRTVLNTMDIREKKSIFRPDMINILMEVRKQMNSTENNSASPKWTDEELVAQCFIFFLAGLDTSSTVMSFAIYELTIHEDIQQKLYEEIKEAHDNRDGKTLDYDTLSGLKYLEMVVKEVLRKRPPAPMTDRMCESDLDYDDGKGFAYKFQKGLNIWIPIYGFHHDPQYFPNPDKFDPERFSDENKHLINQDAYMPFGVGPRQCIGIRFALMEVKTMLYYLVLNYSFHVVEKTQIPLRLSKSIGTVTTENGVWVGLKRRNHN